MENATKLMSCIAEFGFGPCQDLSETDFTRENTVVQFGFEKRQLTIVDGIILHYLDLENLKKNKAATNRKKDQDDLENLSQ